MGIPHFGFFAGFCDIGAKGGIARNERVNVYGSEVVRSSFSINPDLFEKVSLVPPAPRAGNFAPHVLQDDRIWDAPLIPGCPTAKFTEKLLLEVGVLRARDIPPKNGKGGAREFFLVVFRCNRSQSIEEVRVSSN